MNKTYQVVITGISDNYSKTQVTKNLANLFKTPIDAIPDILNQSRYVIKKNIDQITAQKYQASIQQQGCICVIEDYADLDLTIEAPPESTISDVTETIIKKEHKFCRACGSKLSRTAKFCRSCGSDQSKALKDLNSSNDIIKQENSTLLRPIPSSSKASSGEEQVRAKVESNIDVANPHTSLKSFSNVKAVIAGIIIIAMIVTVYVIWSKSRSQIAPIAGSSTTSSIEPNTTADPSTNAEYHEDSTDTVAGKFTIRSFNSSNTDRAIFLNGKEIEKCLNDNQHSICDGEFLTVDKVFNIADKTILMTSYVGGSACPATFQFFTISKDGGYQKSEDFGNCAELPSDSTVISGSKITVTLPTLEQNMMGNEVWTYQNGKVSGPEKNLKPKFNIDVNKAQKIIANSQTLNQVTGEVVKVGENYYLKFDSPVIIVNKFENNQSDVHDGDFVDKLEVYIEHSDNTKIAPNLVKGVFNILITCANAGCGIDKMMAYVPNEAVNTTSAPYNQPSTLNDAINRNEKILSEVLNIKCQSLRSALGGNDPNILAYQLEKAGCQ